MEDLITFEEILRDYYNSDENNFALYVIHRLIPLVNARHQEKIDRLKKTLISIEESAIEAQGEWASVEPPYLPRKGYAAALLKAKPFKPMYHHCTRQQYEQRLLEKGKAAVCSVLRDWVKSQITAVECGIMSFEAVFMPFLLLPQGGRLVDHAATIFEKGILMLEGEHAH